ncbi:MAG: hypothetical protein H0X64_11495 [Gemmatimonadaceae bacterium]|nr:hypothetical protein [Gemmatimonadaceae bacterium]
MRAHFRATALLLAVAACGESTKPPAAASITLSVAPSPLDAIGASKNIVAVVNDEKGGVMSNATVTWTSSSPNATVAPLATSSLTATVTAAGNGEAVITARAGNATASATLVVAQQMAGITGEGSGQTGTVNTPLPNQLVVRIADRMGAPIGGREITFGAGGGGTLSATTVTTATDGSARVTWTLGKVVAEAQQVTASLGLFTTQFQATVRPAAPSQVRKVAGDGQTWFTGSTVPVSPSVVVTDSYDNPISGLEVTFVPTNSNVTGGVQTTNAAGGATVGSWTLGTSDGAASLTATVASAGVSATFNGTVQSSSPPVMVAVTGTVLQAGVEGRAITALPTVRLTSMAGTPVAGRQVTFNITAGGGTTANAVAVSDANGVATMGSWTLGGVSGPNTVTATVEGSAVVSNNPVFTAIGCTGGGSTAGFTINVCFTTPVTGAQRIAFVNAAARWGSVITGDVSDFPISLASPSCGAGAPALHLTIDDLLIFARIEPIDGPGQILGSAGWCYRRSGGLPLVGVMRFDEADVAGLVATNRFDAVILHEMGHVLGIGGSMWSAMGFLQNPTEPGTTPLDTHFNGVQAIAGFDQIGGLSYAGGAKVPVENSMGAGSINSHWRESVLANELMTPQLNMGSNPLTVLTVLSLRDLGYVVDPTAADQSSMSQLHADEPARGSAIDLGARMRDVPKHSIDRAGRIVRLQ